MNILSICSEPNILKIIRIIVLLINIIKITVPIVLIIFLMIKIMGAVSKQNQEEFLGHFHIKTLILEVLKIGGL